MRKMSLSAKRALQRLVEILGAVEVGAERLLDDEAALAAVLLGGEAGGGEVLRGRPEEFRRGREVEEIVFPDLRAFRQLL